MVLSSMVVVARIFPEHRVLVLMGAEVDCFDLRANIRCSPDTLPRRARMSAAWGFALPRRSSFFFLLVVLLL
jgi:hypothetical protein